MKERVPNPATLEDAVARRDAYQNRFAKANDKTAARGQVAVQAGRFELRLAVPESLVTQVRWLQVYVYTDRTPDGLWLDGVCGQGVKLTTEPK
ncbi:MAG: hypothetical protein HY000_10260 [Planctomycetes bacterium]|nr:hypothetical protein [Planctomycetota bacterium]